MREDVYWVRQSGRTVRVAVQRKFSLRRSNELIVSPNVMLQLACTLERFSRAEQRRSSRVIVNGSASVRATGGAREIGAIYNISVGGCAISAPGFYSVGSRVHVRIANFQPFSGEVIWHQDGCIGIQFEVPLHPAVVEHIGSLKLP